jgi:hypothetical protein
MSLLSDMIEATTNEMILIVAVVGAINSLNKLENDPDIGNAWDAKAILEKAMVDIRSSS